MKNTMRFENDFHNSAAVIRVAVGDLVTSARAARVKRALCRVPGCTCGDALGRRGHQPDNGRLALEMSAEPWGSYRVIETA